MSAAANCLRGYEVRSLLARIACKVLALLTIVFAAIAVPGVASADPVAKYEQYRYALETINLSYDDYVARQIDFRANGCTDGATNCRKPAPYNVFDWTDDGCSGAAALGGLGRGPSNVYRNLFNKPCREHDFGYRNFGKGLTLYRNEVMRLKIDDRLKAEMISLCDKTFPGAANYVNWASCQNEASVVYFGVRHLSNWGTTRTPPPAPTSPPTTSSATFRSTPAGGPQGLSFGASSITPCPSTADHVLVGLVYGPGAGQLSTGGNIKTDSSGNWTTGDSALPFIAFGKTNCRMTADCDSSSGASMMKYADQPLNVTAPLSFRGSIVSNTGTSTVMTTVSGAPCPEPATWVYLSFTLASAAGGYVSGPPIRTVALSSGGVWAPQTFVDTVGAGAATYRIYASCQQNDASGSHTVYSYVPLNGRLGSPGIPS